MSMPPPTPFPFDTLSSEDLDPTEQISTAWIEREVMEARAVFVEEAAFDETLEPDPVDATATGIAVAETPSRSLMWFGAGMGIGIGLGAFPASLTVLALVALG